MKNWWKVAFLVLLVLVVVYGIVVAVGNTGLRLSPSKPYSLDTTPTVDIDSEQYEQLVKLFPDEAGEYASLWGDDCEDIPNGCHPTRPIACVDGETATVCSGHGNDCVYSPRCPNGVFCCEHELPMFN